ncbi:hypothetical protein P7K49_040187 [Saguinus oedipus]|uniref:Uncharacterized protein n=1 Tax=Saguinus oedipus TaxID=9490 RepID=A0ABQ9T8L8_SAGOE|nr:hypothetical protein P7K49_040187 [Saguinus oedipus]
MFHFPLPLLSTESETRYWGQVWDFAKNLRPSHISFQQQLGCEDRVPTQVCSQWAAAADFSTAGAGQLLGPPASGTGAGPFAPCCIPRVCSRRCGTAGASVPPTACRPFTGDQRGQAGAGPSGALCSLQDTGLLAQE